MLIDAWGDCLFSIFLPNDTITGFDWKIRHDNQEAVSWAAISDHGNLNSTEMIWDKLENMSYVFSFSLCFLVSQM